MINGKVDIVIKKDNFAYITANNDKLFNLILKSFIRSVKVYNNLYRRYDIVTRKFYSLINKGTIVKVNAGLIDFLVYSSDKRKIQYSLTDERNKASFEDTEVVSEFPDNVRLFDYQKEAVNAILSKPYTCIQIPTGTGKTLIAASVIKTYKEKYRNNGILYVVPTLKLMKEATERFIKYGIKVKNTGLPFDFDCVNIVTYTSLCVKTIDKLDYNTINCIIFDECHRIKGEKSNKIIHNFKNLNFCLGLSATVSKNIETKQKLSDLDEDDMKIVGIFGKPSYYMPIVEAIDNDFIAKLKVHLHRIKVNYDEATENENFWFDVKDKIIYNEDRINEISKHIHDVIAENNYKTVCIYTPEKKMSQDYMTSFYNYLSDKEKDEYKVFMTYGSSKYDVIVDGKIYNVNDEITKVELNDAILDTNIPTVFSATTYFKEGIDIPNLEALFIIMGGKSETQIKQILGRVMRNFQTKEYANIYEFVDKQVVLKVQLNKRLNIYNKDYNATFVKD